MLLIIIFLFLFIVPIFLPKLVQKYGRLEIPNQVPYESVLAVSSGRSYGMCQAASLCFGTWICSIFKCIEFLYIEDNVSFTMYLYISIVFFLFFVFFALFLSNWAFILCTDGIVQRTVLGKVRYYPDASIKGYYYKNKRREICIVTNSGTIGTNWNCSNYYVIKNLIYKYPEVSRFSFF